METINIKLKKSNLYTKAVFNMAIMDPLNRFFMAVMNY